MGDAAKRFQSELAAAAEAWLRVVVVEKGEKNGERLAYLMT